MYQVRITSDSDVRIARALKTSGMDCTFKTFEFNHTFLKLHGIKTFEELERAFSAVQKRIDKDKLRREILED